nr:MAG TPA: hypothetical protein [Caudoviricetes sp.]
MDINSTLTPIERAKAEGCAIAFSMMEAYLDRAAHIIKTAQDSELTSDQKHALVDLFETVTKEALRKSAQSMGFSREYTITGNGKKQSIIGFATRVEESAFRAFLKRVHTAPADQPEGR